MPALRFRAQALKTIAVKGNISSASGYELSIFIQRIFWQSPQNQVENNTGTKVFSTPDDARRNFRLAWCFPTTGRIP